jgi:hypothetical protein
MPFNDTSKNLALDALDESIAAGIKFVGVHTLADPGTATTANVGEATGGSPAYARLGVTWGASATGQKSNTGTLLFDVAAGTYGFFGLYNAVSGNAVGNFLGYIPFGGAAAIKGFGECDSTDVTNDTITSSGHGLTTDDRVMLYNVFAETIPAGLTEGTIYFVLASGLTTDVFKVALTSGGTAINITGQGELYFQKVIPEVFGAQGQISVAAAALVLDATTM